MSSGIVNALPLSLAPVMGESATSLASRLAYRNGSPRLLTFCTDMALCHRELTNGLPDDVQRLAWLAGQNFEELQFWTPRLVEKGCFRLGKEKLKFTALARTQARACPACIAEGVSAGEPHSVGHLGTWQLESIRTCAKHHCLLEHLPAAETGKDIFDVVRMAERAEPRPPRHISGSDRCLEEYLVDRILNGPGNSWIDSLPFHVAAQTAENLGVLLTLGPDLKRTEVNDAAWFRAGAEGYRVLRQGPGALLATLTEIKKGFVNDAGRYRTRYRFFFEWLRYRDTDADFDGIRDLVRNFIWHSFPVAKGALVLGKRCPEQMVHSLSTAVTATGITRRQLGRRLCAMGFARPGNGPTGFIIDDYIPTDVVKRITTEFAGLLNATEAAAYIGVKPFMLTKLTRPNLISVVNQGSNILPLYRKKDLDDFLARLDARKEAYQPVDGWMEIATAAHRAKITAEQATTLILVHMLPLRCHREGAGYRDFHVELASLREAMTLPSQGAVHPSRAAKLLKLDSKTVLTLLETRHLDRVLVKNPTTGRPIPYVCPTSIEHFDQTHISLRSLNRVRRLSSADQRALRLELEPFELKLGSGTEPIYQRHEIDFVN